MTDATNLIHRLAELRAGVLYRIRLHFRRWSRLGLHRGEAKETRPFLQYHAALAAIDSCADAAEVLREVRRSTRRVYRRLLDPVPREDITIGGWCTCGPCTRGEPCRRSQTHVAPQEQAA